MASSSRIFIAGNGPSLREVDFTDLQFMDWLGMNAAYRYWDRINVYPTIYSCLDKVVIKSHASEILRLYSERKVNKFFLVKDILEELPGFPQDDRVFFLEDMAQSTVKGTEIFKTAFSDKKTTGSWAVRFAIFLGYREIYLSGIDASYVETIKEAQHTGSGLELKIASQVSKNPNYFFDDYQKKGDVYQVPNPAQHYGNLHLQSFEALNVDISRLGLDISIFNTAIGSQLHRLGVYEYKSLKEALNRPALQAVAVPLTTGEVPQFIRNLALWDSPAFHPLRLDSPLMGRIALHLFFDGEYDTSIVASVSKAFSATKWVSRIFSGIKITFLAIPTALNHYIRDPKCVSIPRKMGPNLHFLAMMRKCRNYCYTQLLETDCVPAKADWLTDLNSTCTRQGPFWVAGAYLDELGNVTPCFSLHINGNALYATGDPGFIDFLQEVFEPALHYLIFKNQDFSLAYDCLISRLITHVLSSSVQCSGVKPDPILVKFHSAVQANLDRFRFVRLYKNISHVDGDLSDTALLGMLDSEAVIIHSRRLSQLITDTLEMHRGSLDLKDSRPQIQRRLMDTFIRAALGDIHPVRYYSNLDGLTFTLFDRSIGVIQLMATKAAAADTEINAGAYILFNLERPTVERMLTCRIELISDTEQMILVRFSRHGAGQFVEKQIEAHVTSNIPGTFELAFVCPENYSSARLQLKPLGGNSGKLKARFSVTDVLPSGLTRHDEIDTDTSVLKELYEQFRYEIYENKVVAIATTTTPSKVTRRQQPIGISDSSGVSLCTPASHDGKTLLIPIGERGYPPARLLMIDSTPVGHNSATGQIKQTFLGDWPTSNFLQIWETGGVKSTLRSFRLGQSIDQSSAVEISISKAIELCRDFQPDVIYFRPVDSDLLFAAAEQVSAAINKPLVIHMMDDWPERLKTIDTIRFQKLDGTLRRLLSRAYQRLSICQDMSDVYQIRYGGEWLPLANGVDLLEFPAKDWSKRPPVTTKFPFVIRYMGALADDMTYSSVCEIATAVSSLQAACAVRFEIYTMEWCRSKAELELEKLPGVSVHPLVEVQRYKQTLAEADALVIAYNFNPESITYTGLSLANKMPECLASGSPLIAYGPMNVATIRYLKETGCAQVVDSRDQESLISAIQALIKDSSLCQRLSEQARSHVAVNCSKQLVQEKFKNYLSRLNKMAKNVNLAPMIGAFSREQHAHYDETDCISELFKKDLHGQVMIDVGAHHGWAHLPFLDRDWRIFAFEPDNQNRTKLLERLAKHKNKHLILLDTRCVSNKSQKGVSFFNSKQSTGISGLSAFHDSHVESQKVDTTTLTEFFEDKPLTAVDFLKIDTEGHDMFVLHGFPWERGKPAVIECEFEDSKTVPLGYTFHDLARFLVDEGYTVYVSEWHPIIRYGIRHDWRQLMRYPCELVDPKGWGNLLAFRDPIDQQALIEAVKKVLKVGGGESPQKPVLQSKPPAPVKPAVAIPVSGAILGFRFKPGTHFTSIAPNQWRFTDDEAKQKLWIAAMVSPISTAGRTFGGILRVMADRAITINVSIGRHGKTVYEGATKRVVLTPGSPQTVQLNKQFKSDHEALKLQVEVVELINGGSAVLTIDQLGLSETLASIQERLDSSHLNLSTANRLFREGDYTTALGIYLWLSQRHPLSMYVDNIVRSAKQIGFSWVKTLGDLNWLLDSDG